MKDPLIAAAVGFGLMASTGGASADPWRDESGHGRFGSGEPWKHEGRGHRHAHGHRRERLGVGYGRSRGYRGARFRDYDHWETTTFGDPAALPFTRQGILLSAVCAKGIIANGSDPL
jgi:hypothetical protein